MIRFHKKAPVLSLLLTCASLFLFADEKTFNIPGKGSITRDVQLKRVEHYDKKGLLTSASDGYGPEENYKYNKKGKVTLFTYSNEYENKFEYDKKGNLIHTEDNEGYEVWYSYDAKGKLLLKKDSCFLEHHYYYNQDGTLASYELHDIKGDAIILTESYYYDSKKRKNRMESSDGYEVYYTYTKDGKILEEDYSDKTKIRYVYSDTGNLLYRCTNTADSEHEEFYEYEFWGKGKIKTVKKYLWEVFG